MFLFKATAFYWVVWALTKTITTWLSISHASVLNAWYNFNSQAIEAIPRYGQTLHALVRDNVSDGTFAFWEVWIVVGIVVAVFKPRPSY